ncbi:hypothetical protein BJ165DRAFT_1344898, partial [Panaeolus papilionaceus]
FPSSKWTNILKGLCINLDAVFSSLHLKVAFRKSEPAKTITNAADWTSAWNACIEAHCFVFKHRCQELQQYGR